MLMNELQSLHCCLLEFFRNMAVKRLKIRITYSDSDSDVEGDENHNTKRKTESYVFSGLGNCIPRGRERKSTAGRFDTARF